MAGENTSTNMLLPLPGVGITAGSLWATDLNSCLTIVDSHNHSTGSGVQITPSGLNINADLTMAINNLTNIRSLRLYTNAAVLALGSDLGCLYRTGIDLYYNDGNGVQIPITSGGGVAGSPGSIGSLAAPAAATYTAGSKLFTWTSGASKAAAMDNGAVTIRETNVASAKGITLLSAASLAADFNITLPAALPASTQLLNMTNAGFVANISYDSVGSSMTSTGANAIAATRTRATGTSVAAGGVAISSSCGGFNTASTSYIDITNLSVTITTSGRPVKIFLATDGTDQPSLIGAGATSPTRTAGADFKILRDGLFLARHSVFIEASPTGGNLTTWVPSSCIQYLDPVGAGTYVYKLQIVAGVSNSAYCLYNKLIAYEL